MSFFNLNDILGNPPEEEPAKTAAKKPDIPVSKKSTPPASAEKKPAEPAKSESTSTAEKKSEPAKSESTSTAEKKSEPAKSESTSTAEKKSEPANSESATTRRKATYTTANDGPSMADLKEAVRKTEEVDAKLSVNVPLSQLFARLSLSEKFRLIRNDPSAMDIILKIVQNVVEKTPDALLDKWGGDLLKTAFDCDDLRAKMLDRIVANDDWNGYVVDAVNADTKRRIQAEEACFKELSDEIISDPETLNKFVKKLLASKEGRKAIFDAINNS
ncbi:hypothetical protein IKG45_02765 [Candidatus Saccharibacteria bacterium]|nr:hypothetical protein [Candidatus Saccharibacteria bacterium]